MATYGTVDLLFLLGADEFEIDPGAFVVYIGSHDHRLYAVDAQTGKERWSFTSGGGIESSPAVAGGVVYVGSHDHHLYALDAQTGKELRRYTTGGGIISSPRVVGDSVYIGSNDGNVYAFHSVHNV